PGDAGAAGGRRHKARQDPHGRCFTGAIRPEKSHDLALADLKIQILDRGLPGVAFGQIFNLNHRELPTIESVNALQKTFTLYFLFLAADYADFTDADPRCWILDTEYWMLHWALD